MWPSGQFASRSHRAGDPSWSVFCRVVRSDTLGELRGEHVHLVRFVADAILGEVDRRSVERIGLDHVAANVEKPRVHLFDGIWSWSRAGSRCSLRSVVHQNRRVRFWTCRFVPIAPSKTTMRSFNVSRRFAITITKAPRLTTRSLKLISSSCLADYFTWPQVALTHHAKLSRHIEPSAREAVKQFLRSSGLVLETGRR